ncbi:hypothetical protein XELAEV_18042691mg [Xenopus laevis]|uniref:GIY-YIG domain-containing protein n=1 Tax=Xenopus laevis TaxID=8355 RepID=A0A974C5A9_XENLA|nr:hypothetical protein XELAEV_18042691mg [Xenopus laevis]
MYLQLMGSAMGSKKAPQYANLFMAQRQLIIWTESEKELLAFHQRFNQFHPTINLTLNHSYSHTNFLDTTIYIKTGTIQTSLYQKPTGHPAYLIQALRYNRICANLDDRNKHLHSLRKTFVNQGYHPQVIDDQIHRATQTPRYTQRKDRNQQDPNTHKVYTILDHYSCASSNVVYMITCTRCSTGGKYIGETGQKLSTRMNHHRHKINSKSCDTPVGQHFCSQNHSVQDVQVLILKGNFKTERERKIYESKLMELFNTLRQGLNLGSGFMSHYVT